MCTRCRGTGEITNAKGQTDACPDCARAAEVAWRGWARLWISAANRPGKINVPHEVSR